MTIMQVLLASVAQAAAHMPSVIKQIDQTNGSASGLIDDDELFAELRANRLYQIRCCFYLTATGAASFWRLACDDAVAFASLSINMRAGSVGDGWPTATTNSNWAWIVDTDCFNAQEEIPTHGASPQSPTIWGMIKTINACTLNLQWGHTSGTPNEVVHAASFLQVREIEEV